MRKSGILIDHLIVSNFEKSDSGYIKRQPKNEFRKLKLMSFPKRIRACWRVLTDRGLVVYFKEDE